MNRPLICCFLLLVQMAFAQPEGLVRIRDLAELDVEATEIQFRNRETHQYIVWRKPYLEVYSTPDKKGWRFSGYDQQRSLVTKVNIHTPSAPTLDWSNFPTRREYGAFVALTPAKKGEAVALQWEIRAAKSKDYFLLYHPSSGEYVCFNNRSQRLTTHELEEFHIRQEWEIWADKRRLLPTKRDAVRDFSTDTSFHKGWSYGYLDSATAVVFRPYASPAEEPWGQGGWALPNEKTGIYCTGEESPHLFLEESYFIAPSTLFYYLNDTTARLPVLRYTIPQNGVYTVRFNIFSQGREVTPKIIVQEATKAPPPIAPPPPIGNRRSRTHLLFQTQTFQRGDVVLFYAHSINRKGKHIEVQATVRPLPNTD